MSWDCSALWLCLSAAQIIRRTAPFFFSTFPKASLAPAHCVMVLPMRPWEQRGPLPPKWLFSLGRPLVHRASRGLRQVLLLEASILQFVCALRMSPECMVFTFLPYKDTWKKTKTWTLWHLVGLLLSLHKFLDLLLLRLHHTPPSCQVDWRICVSSKHKRPTPSS